MAGRLSGTLSKPVMWITPGRVFYAGLLGHPSVRRIGGTLIYIAQQAPMRLSLDGGESQEADVLVVPPRLPHRVACDSPSVIALIIEPETVDDVSLPVLIRDGRGAVQAPEFVAHVQAILAALQGRGNALPLDDGEFDQCLFGSRLARKLLDHRIAEVVADIVAHPGGTSTAEHYAAQVQLSFSRLLHLFKEEVGVSMRTFRSWKRARSLLHYVTQKANLADIAQHAGYPDSSHLSHSIRQVFGLTPRDMFAGSRKLHLHGEPLADSALSRFKA
jgi:AraC-like DNA-binding protein